MKTSDLDGIILDWAVTTILEPETLRFGVDDWRDRRRTEVIRGEYIHRYHQSWSQGGPILERELIRITPLHMGREWEATLDLDEGDAMVETQRGPTPLIAVMRCFVASRLGDEIEIPEELK